MYVEAAGKSVSSVITKPTSTAKIIPMSENENTIKVESMEGDSLKIDKESKGNSNGNTKESVASEDKLAADNEKIKKAIEKMNAQLPNAEIKFGIHEKTERVTIKLIDRDSKEVIKEFPPEKTLDMIAKCMELAGVLVDQKL